MNISLPESLKAFVEEQVARSGYSTPSEYVRELIREAQKRRVEERLLLQALKKGKAGPMTAKDWERIRARVFPSVERSESKRRREAIE